MVSRGTTQQSSGPYNRRIVLDVIRRQGTMSRKEIVDLVSLSPQTVANITQDLEAIGLIVSMRLKEKCVDGHPRSLGRWSCGTAPLRRHARNWKVSRMQMCSARCDGTP